jgi:hypothetical protein
LFRQLLATYIFIVKAILLNPCIERGLSELIN